MTTAPRERASAEGPAAGRGAKTKIAEIALVCARCAKRQGLRPREVRDLLKRAAKRTPGAGKLRVVSSGCLGPCPKRALTVATGASIAAGRVIMLDPAAGPAAIAAAVLPGRAAPAARP